MNRVRDDVQFPLEGEYFERRIAAGWKLKAIEWEKDDGGKRRRRSVEVPYGMEVVPGRAELQPNEAEITVMLTVLELIVRDQSIPMITEELQRRGLRNREGAAWRASAVFDLLPRVIEMGPTLLAHPRWQSMRSAMQLSF